MATTSYPLNHPLAVKLWSKMLYHEALKETHAGQFIGSGSDALIQTRDDFKKSAGDRIRMGLRMQLSGAGVSGDSTLEGQEEALTTYHDDLLIDQLRHAVRSDGKMSEQRVPFSVREESMMGLRDWWADRIDTAFFNHLAGNTGQADTKYTGSNATIAPSTTTGNSRIIYGPDDETTENSLSSASASNNFQLTLIDKAVTLAQTATPVLRPAKLPDGRRRFVLFLHPFQAYSLKIDATANRITWYDANKARIQGGELDNPIFGGGPLGEYNGVLLYVNTRIPVAPSGVTTVRRAVFCGAQAIAMATGRDNSPERMSWFEERFDYGNQLGVSAGMIWGMKKMQFNSIDFGTIVISTHAESP